MAVKINRVVIFANGFLYPEYLENISKKDRKKIQKEHLENSNGVRDSASIFGLPI